MREGCKKEECELRKDCSAVGLVGECLKEFLREVANTTEIVDITKHTGAPWHATGSMSVTSTLGNLIQGVLVNSVGSSVAIVIVEEGECPREEFLANVLLVQKAPELYEWGKNALAMLSVIATLGGLELSYRTEAARLAAEFPDKDDSEEER